VHAASPLRVVTRQSWLPPVVAVGGCLVDVLCFVLPVVLLVSFRAPATTCPVPRAALVATAQAVGGR
jgi:hypothetical protein